MATKPTQDDIRKLTEQKMFKLGHIRPEPGDPSYDAKLKLYEAALEKQTRDAELHLNRVHDLDVARETEAAERDQAELDAATDQLRWNYLAQPGATEQEFNEVLPDLLREQRKAAALSGQSDLDLEITLAKQRLGRIA